MVKHDNTWWAEHKYWIKTPMRSQRKYIAQRKKMYSTDPISQKTFFHLHATHLVDFFFKKKIYQQIPRQIKNVIC